MTPARNAAMALAVDAGFDHLAFLDDDEVPEPAWLEELMRTVLAERCDIVCGPVEPVFGGPPPDWALSGRFFHKSGETMCSSNLLLRAGALPADRRNWFYPEFGTTGGGDREFLKRLVDGGARSAVAPRALVREHVPVARLALGYMFRRGLRDGMTDVQILKRRRATLWRVWLAPRQSRQGSSDTLSITCSGRRFVPSVWQVPWPMPGMSAGSCSGCSAGACGSTGRRRGAGGPLAEARRRQARSQQARAQSRQNLAAWRVSSHSARARSHSISARRSCQPMTNPAASIVSPSTSPRSRRRSASRCAIATSLR
ncbi:MAG: glycosyltransferase [Alphaproteobacteria bacterium]|nr:glycosyltransferase [Alphaproteobacteria bacterium]